MKKFLVGIDEVGRGPLAGPVSVGVVLVPHDFDWALLPGVTDSKKLTSAKREAIYGVAVKLQAAGKLIYRVVSEPASVIDTIGIAGAIRSCLEQGLQEVLIDTTFGVIAIKEVEVLLDGGLKAPVDYIHQQTIIKGDASEAVIGLASIVAKVERDREMVRLAEVYPLYGIEIHKGYGTKIHREAIARYGLSQIHRRTFCKNIVLPQ